MKASTREANALERRSTNNSTAKPSNPDAFQWNMYERDKKMREDEIVASKKPIDDYDSQQQPGVSNEDQV